jgi:hypothetical protein
MAKCGLCPVPVGLDCPAITLPHPRFCTLLAMGRDDYRPVILAMAKAGPPDPAPSPTPIDAAARRAAKPRVSLGVSQHRR